MPTLMVVPTGVGCRVGGYAGDALPAPPGGGVGWRLHPGDGPAQGF
ncbi:MAG: DUF3326 domain-containing protein, partial [Cyanobium sp.]